MEQNISKGFDSRASCNGTKLSKRLIGMKTVGNLVEVCTLPSSKCLKDTCIIH
jgi:hypothetical protein